jgi:xanthine dehydrogenase accessory factor
MAPVTEDATIFDAATRLSRAGERFVLVTVVRSAGSTPRKPGAKMIVLAGGGTIGTVGGGAVEQALVAEALVTLAERRPRLVTHHLTRDLAMCCGGEMQAVLDPLGLRETLVLVGGGHIHAALAPVAAALGFEVIVVDDLEELASAERFPLAARRLLSFEPREWGVSLGEDAYVVVATRDHATDQEVLEKLFRLGVTPRYLGVIGSRAKLARFRQRLEVRGVDAGWIGRIRGPIGVDVGAETPAEIAVAVAAELVAVRRRGPGAVTREPAEARRDRRGEANGG